MPMSVIERGEKIDTCVVVKIPTILTCLLWFKCYKKKEKNNSTYTMSLIDCCYGTSNDNNDSHQYYY